MGRLGFGPLWAINVETLAAGQRIPLHAHERMEIITIPLEGSLRHLDSRGVSHMLIPGDIHMLSAGKGITHWEFNDSATAPARYLQIWIESTSPHSPVRYEQGVIRGEVHARFVLVAAPAGEDAIVTIDQRAFVSLASIENRLPLRYRMHDAANALYCLAVAGQIHAGEHVLSGGQGMVMASGLSLEFTAPERATLLCVEALHTYSNR